MTVFDFEKHQKQEAPQGTKLTANRLSDVEDIQKTIAMAVDRLNKLAEQEANGWVPGTPQTKRTHRVEPIEKLAEQLAEGIDLLERLYS
jgi:hypothetical protein